jgi:hypothetical protein
MELAINFSPQAAQLYADKRIHVDRFKCPDWPDMIEEARALAPVYVHFPLDAGALSGRSSDFDAIDAMVRDTDTPFVNYHLVAYARDFPGTPPETEDPHVTSLVLDRTVAELERAIERFGADRVILENIPYYAPGGKYMRASVDPSVLHDDLAWTRWAFDRIAAGAWATPRLVAFEYGGIGEPFKWRSEASVIERDVNRLNEMLANLR